MPPISLPSRVVRGLSPPATSCHETADKNTLNTVLTCYKNQFSLNDLNLLVESESAQTKQLRMNEVYM
ncbi:MAG TPA: hypothetical protein ACFYEJ_06380 [Candidatus Wujingus californicus]|uniref:hypothetical protein n=1 Tax=Candidatus Wujingus californicus TaxID=3367618 RepID=UPI001D31DEDA|nr:hypothetical protein [Planctomycetota bacterium]